MQSVLVMLVLLIVNLSQIACGARILMRTLRMDPQEESNRSPGQGKWKKRRLIGTSKITQAQGRLGVLHESLTEEAHARAKRLSAAKPLGMPSVDGLNGNKDAYPVSEQAHSVPAAKPLDELNGKPNSKWRLEHRDGVTKDAYPVWAADQAETSSNSSPSASSSPLHSHSSPSSSSSPRTPPDVKLVSEFYDMPDLNSRVEEHRATAHGKSRVDAYPVQAERALPPSMGPSTRVDAYPVGESTRVDAYPVGARSQLDAHPVQPRAIPTNTFPNIRVDLGKRDAKEGPREIAEKYMEAWESGNIDAQIALLSGHAEIIRFVSWTGVALHQSQRFEGGRMADGTMTPYLTQASQSERIVYEPFPWSTRANGGSTEVLLPMRSWRWKDSTDLERPQWLHMQAALTVSSAGKIDRIVITPRAAAAHVFPVGEPPSGEHVDQSGELQFSSGLGATGRKAFKEPFLSSRVKGFKLHENASIAGLSALSGSGSQFQLVEVACESEHFGGKVYLRKTLPTPNRLLFAEGEVFNHGALPQHPNLVSLFFAYGYKGDVNLLLEYARDGDLYEFVNHLPGVLSDNLLKNLCLQLLTGLKVIHDSGIAHRDIKPENVFLSGDTLKIGDFGLSTRCRVGEKSSVDRCGTLRYAAPEVVCPKRGTPYDPMMADVWSMGHTLYVLAARQALFHDESLPELRRQVCTDAWQNNKVVVPEGQRGRPVVDFIMDNMLVPRPESRRNADALLRHPFLHEVSSLATLRDSVGMAA